MTWPATWPESMSRPATRVVCAPGASPRGMLLAHPISRQGPETHRSFSSLPLQNPPHQRRADQLADQHPDQYDGYHGIGEF